MGGKGSFRPAVCAPRYMVSLRIQSINDCRQTRMRFFCGVTYGESSAAGKRSLFCAGKMPGFPGPIHAPGKQFRSSQAGRGGVV